MESDKVTYAEREVCSDEEAGNGRVKAGRAGLLLKQSQMPLGGKKKGGGGVSACKSKKKGRAVDCK